MSRGSAAGLPPGIRANAPKAEPFNLLPALAISGTLTAKGVHMRKSILMAALAAAAAAAPAAASAQDWRVVAIDRETQRGISVAYADATSIRRSGDEVRFFMQVRFGSPPPEFDGLRAEMRIECSARRWGSEGSALYLGEQRGQDVGGNPLQEVRPDTNAALILDNLCNGRFESGTVDPAVHSRGVFAGQ